MKPMDAILCIINVLGRYITQSDKPRAAQEMLERGVHVDQIRQYCSEAFVDNAELEDEHES